MMGEIPVFFLHGLVYAGLLFLVSSGLTLVFGMMNVLNLAHAAFYMLGAYFSYSVLYFTGNFYFSLIVCPLLLFILGAFQVVGELFHKAGEKDFAPYVSQIINSGAEVLWTPNWGNDLTLLIKQGKNLGMKAKIASYYLNDEYLIKSVGDDSAIIGNITAESYMLTIPTEKNKKFIEGFYKEKGYYPSWLRGKAYTATMFWAEAVKKAGKDDVDAVIKAWEGLTYEGPAGTYYMRPCDHQAQIPVWIAEMVKDSKFFKHAFVGEPTMIPAKDIEITCEETGCKMK
ncbi:MAG: ABC transporter substrate-binding protein [Desulfobacteraceae bacterium]|nr:MAG: ABC transporter substrate-binding protein [Desulfobacteraceae bacterium]